MAASSRLGRQITEIVAMLDRADAPAALIGGLALASHGVVRATQDVDFLTDAGLANVLHGELLTLGYRCLHRSPDAANYVRGDERLDLLYASRPVARRLLAEAQPHANADTVNRGDLRDYFRLFDREVLLDELLAELA